MACKEAKNPDFNCNTVEIGVFCPPKCTGKEAKKPDRQKTPYFTINCTLKLLHTLNQQQLDIYIQ